MNEIENILDEQLFCLTGIKQLLRILDMGLIVPELVVCDQKAKIKILSLTDLKSMGGINGYPAKPVLFELNNSLEVENKIISTSNIKTIHFESEDELDDYIARVFFNVPNGIYNFRVSPQLFECIDSNLEGILFDLFQLDIA